MYISFGVLCYNNKNKICLSKNFSVVLFFTLENINRFKDRPQLNGIGLIEENDIELVLRQPFLRP